jgi:hypothetical protein
VPRRDKSVDPLLTEADLARELQVLPNYLAKLRIRGDGPRFVKLGGKVRYRRSALQAWLQAREFSSTSEQPRT